MLSCYRYEVHFPVEGCMIRKQTYTREESGQVHTYEVTNVEPVVVSPMVVHAVSFAFLQNSNPYLSLQQSNMTIMAISFASCKIPDINF